MKWIPLTNQHKMLYTVYVRIILVSSYSCLPNSNFARVEVSEQSRQQKYHYHQNHQISQSIWNLSYAEPSSQ